MEGYYRDMLSRAKEKTDIDAKDKRIKDLEKALRDIASHAKLTASNLAQLGARSDADYCIRVARKVLGGDT